MQIIQGIRDRGAALAIIIIVLCLIGFILMDAKTGTNSSLFGGNSTSVGKINGNTIDLADYSARVDKEAKKQAQTSGQQPAGAQLLEIREQVWNQIVAENVFYAEAAKLGITLTAKELSAILMSSDQSNPLMQERSLVTSEGQLDPVKAREVLNNIKKYKGEDRENVDYRIIEPLKLTTAATKYGGMIAASAYYPAWMKQKDESDSKNFATISYTTVAYNEIPDSTIKVTDEDIEKYTSKKKDLFKQEAGRTISYLSFSQLPSGADSSKAMKDLADMAPSFAADTNTQSYLDKNNSSTAFNKEFLPVAKITSPAKDTIVRQATGGVYGPFIEGNNIALAKLVGVKQLPDSVKARHILIPLNDAKGQPIRTDSAAKVLADSILAAVKSGADFSALAIKYSSDGSAAKGGDLGTFGYGTMVPEFNEFSFTKPVGEKGVVKTQYGYHVIDVVNQTNFKPAYQIAYLARPVVASDETVNAASRAATNASSAGNSKALTEYAAKNGLKMTEMTATIKENDFKAGNYQDARSLVKWVFNAKKGDVSEPIPTGSDFIVATVNKIYDEGTQDAATARANAEALVRNEKKAAIIIAKMGKTPTVESAASAYNKTPLTAGADSSITMSAQVINGIGNEPKVIGAAFSKSFLNKPSQPIAGTAGVYVIKTLGISQKTPVAPEQATAQATARFATIRQQSNNWFEAMRKQAEIKDKRSKFF